MQSTSRQISSNQTGLHPRLAEVVQRHRDHPDQSPAHPHSITAYQQLCQLRIAYPGPMVLDSFCGTGHSTALLAKKHPQHLVVGIDKSDYRLTKHQGEKTENCVLLQARCEDIWHALAADGEVLSHHYLFYPNPWPKSAQLQRRVHGHPAFPALLRLGGQLELRSNWQTYIEEFGVAVHLAGGSGYVSRVPDEKADISLFERKYRKSGHPLWRFNASLKSPFV
jgi:tRNA (guanine-N7-)-methyltransferase